MIIVIVVIIIMIAIIVSVNSWKIVVRLCAHRSQICLLTWYKGWGVLIEGCRGRRSLYGGVLVEGCRGRL